MSINGKLSLIAGVTVFLYVLIIQNFWPDINIFVNALLAAIVGGGSYKIGDLLFRE